MPDKDKHSYVIEERDGEWCLLSADRSKTLGCHDSKEKAEAQEKAVKAEAYAKLGYAAVQAEHPIEAEKFFAEALSVLGIVGQPAELVKVFAGFSEGMCEKWGMGAEGGATKCISGMEGKVDDAGAFCASLHQWCTGTWPAEKKARQVDADAVKRFFSDIGAVNPSAPMTMPHKMFDDLIAEQESREDFNKLYWPLSDSVQSILSDSKLTIEQRRKMIAETMTQFIAALKGKFPDIESYDEAEAAVKAYGVPPDDPQILNGVELFATGKHNGDDYSEKDLDDMVTAYADQGYQAPLKLGHDETPGKPAVGWVTNLRREGEKLLGDITHIPKDLYDMIKRRGYDRVSAEIYWNLKSAGKTFRRALKAVALLGADVPAVSSLTPLHKLFSGVSGEVKFYDSDKGVKRMLTEKEQLAKLQEQLAELTKQIAESGGDADAPAAKVLTEVQAQVKLLAKKLEEKTETDKKLLSMQDENADLTKRLSVLEDERRKGRIASIVSEVKIPAFRPYMQALLEAATDGEEKVVKFSRAGKVEDRTVESIVRDMIGDINKMSHGLWKEHTQGGGRRMAEGEDMDYTDKQAVANLVDRKAKAYSAEHKIKYGDALRAVLESEPELKSAYTS